MSHQQLTEGKRYQISALLAEGYSQAAVARAIGVHPLSITESLPEMAQKKLMSQSLRSNRQQTGINQLLSIR